MSTYGSVFLIKLSHTSLDISYHDLGCITIMCAVSSCSSERDGLITAVPDVALVTVKSWYFHTSRQSY